MEMILIWLIIIAIVYACSWVVWHVAIGILTLIRDWWNEPLTRRKR